MNDLFGLFNDLRDLAAELIRVGGGATIRTVRMVMRRLSTAARLAIILPFVLLLAAMAGYEYAQYAVPILTILILLLAIWRLTGPLPLGILIAGATLSPEIDLLRRFACEIRRVTRILRIIFGLELLAAIYCCTIPVANDPRSGLVLVLIVAGIFCFAGIREWRWVVVVLIIGFCVVTLMFCMGGRSKLYFKPVHAESSNGQTDGATKKSPAGRPASGDTIKIEEPLSSGRAKDGPSGMTTREEPPMLSPQDDDPSLPPKQVTQTIGFNSIMITSAHRLNNGELELDGYVASESAQQIDFSIEEGGYANLGGKQVRIWRTNIQFGDSWHAQVGDGAPATTGFTIYLKDPSVAYAKVATIELEIGINGNVGLTPWFPPIRVQ